MLHFTAVKEPNGGRGGPIRGVYFGGLAGNKGSYVALWLRVVPITCPRSDQSSGLGRPLGGTVM